MVKSAAYINWSLNRKIHQRSVMYVLQQCQLMKHVATALDLQAYKHHSHTKYSSYIIPLCTY